MIVNIHSLLSYLSFQNIQVQLVNNTAMIEIKLKKSIDGPIVLSVRSRSQDICLITCTYYVSLLKTITSGDRPRSKSQEWPSQGLVSVALYRPVPIHLLVHVVCRDITIKVEF